MYTPKSSVASKVKMLLFIPTALAGVVCFSETGFSQGFEKKGNIVTYRGNTFEYNTDTKSETKMIADPITKIEQPTTITEHPVPVKMNGETIYGSYKSPKITAHPEPYAKKGSLEDNLLKKLSKDLNKLPDGTYRMELSNVVVDTRGKIVYYEFKGLISMHQKTPDDVQKEFTEKLDKAINHLPALKPGKLQDNEVVSLASVSLMEYKIEVKDHISTVTKSWK